MPQHLGAASPAGFPPDLVTVLKDMADSLKEIAATLKRLENKAKQAAMLSMSRRAKALGVPVTTLLE